MFINRPLEKMSAAKKKLLLNLLKRKLSNEKSLAANKVHPSIHVYLHQETNHNIMQARQRSRTERSINDAHNCPKT